MSALFAKFAPRKVFSYELENPTIWAAVTVVVLGVLGIIATLVGAALLVTPYLETKDLRVGWYAFGLLLVATEIAVVAFTVLAVIYEIAVGNENPADQWSRSETVFFLLLIASIVITGYGAMRAFRTLPPPKLLWIPVINPILAVLSLILPSILVPSPPPD